MKEKFLKQAKQEHDPRERVIALIIEGIFFLGVLPGALVYFSPLLDSKLSLSPLTPGYISTIFGCVLVVTGIMLAWWAIYIQFTIGRGTPVPIMATQRLIIQKPYSYCRNPMALGAIGLYLGVAILRGSISATGLVLTFTALLLSYIKLLEEKEMELRFGKAYLEYRKQTPFIIPRFRKGK
jgi:protein-S-isoprenylcysteine O-methyltransferase Ste14